MFHGSMVAIITPMHEDKTVDFTSFGELIEWHIASGTSAIVVLGTTGESPTITSEERTRIIKECVGQVRGRVPIIAGTGTNSTQQSIYLTQEAMELGVDACLIVTPYYNKPTQEGLFLHYKSIADTVAIPQIMYNVPGRTGCDLLPETAARLAKVTNIIGLKEATGDITRVRTILDHTDSRLDLFSGDDVTFLDLMLAGGKGVVSVTANIVPEAMHQICEAVMNNEVEKAQSLNGKIMPLHQKLFIEPNPIPVKWALQEMGRIQSGIRLPLTRLSEKNQESVRKAMVEIGI